MKKQYRSDALGAIHETAYDLHDAGVMDKRTLRKIRQNVPDPCASNEAGGYPRAPQP